MEKDRRIKVLSIIALLIAVVGLTVAFSEMSKTLTINCSAKMDTAKWDIRFENLTTEIEGTGKVITAPTLKENDTYIGDFEVTLSKPGDSVTFNFEIVNKGDIASKFSDYLINGYNLYNQDGSDEYTLKLYDTIFEEADWNGDGITTQEEVIETIEKGIFIEFFLDEEKTLNNNETDNARLKIYFDSEATEVPKGKIKLKANVQYLYDQA